MTNPRPLPNRNADRPDPGPPPGRIAGIGRLAFIPACICLLLAVPSPSAAAGNPLQETARFTPGVTETLLEADFWIRRTAEPDRVLMAPSEIGRFNRGLASGFPFMTDVEHHPELSGAQVKALIASYRLPRETRYDSSGRPADGGFYDGLGREKNLDAVPETVAPLWGVTVRRTAVRSFPTAEPSRTAPDPQGSDLFQETEADLWTPLVILHRSRSGRWAFVRTYHYHGWVPLADIAPVREKASLFSLLDQPDFLVATGSWGESQLTGAEGTKLRFMMGTKLPLVARDRIPREHFGHNPQGNYVVWVPGRDGQGFFTPVMAYVSAQADVHRGWLPYTRRNLLRQAFKMLGERYSWGGSFEGRDCSRLIVDVFRTVGILLPRNASQQARVGLDRFAGDTGLARLEPGAGLYMPGHAMLFLGNHEGRSYAIHSVAGFRNLPGGEVHSVRGVVVSDLSVLPDGAGSLTAAREFLPAP
jgi:hypothetical protein